MPLPTPLLRLDAQAHKNTYGHVLVLAGSRSMLGAPALCGLAAMRCGAGLVTLGIARDLNLTLQKKISPVMMTLPLAQTRNRSLSARAWGTLQKHLSRFQAVALGPGLGREKSTKNFILKITAAANQPLVIDADGLNALSSDLQCLRRARSVRILTPHPGEMSRLISRPTKDINKNRQKTARAFAREHGVILVLKGAPTVVASADGEFYLNSTGNSGMATAGSGDVLTGMIAALLAQGCNGFEAARWGVYLHGLAGDLAAKTRGRAGMIASDIITQIPQALKSFKDKKKK